MTRSSWNRRSWMALAAALVLAVGATVPPTGSYAQTATPTPEATPTQEPSQTPAPTEEAPLPLPEPVDPTGEQSLSPEEKAPPGPADEVEGISLEHLLIGGGPRNIVKLRNRVDGGLRVRGNIQLNHISSSRVGPVNL